MLDSEQLYIGIGGRIKRVREAAGMTQEELARVLELKRTSITNIERGNQKPTLDTLYRFCERFGLDISSVLPSVADVTRAENRSVVVGGKAEEVGPKTAMILDQVRARARERR